MNVMPGCEIQAPRADVWMTKVTPHAEIRMQQRGVDKEMLSCLLQYGRPQFCQGGCEILLVDDTTLDAIAKHESHRLWLEMADARDLYAVVNSDGYVVTTGHRFRRVLRDISLSTVRPGRSRRPGIRRKRPVWYQFN